nr:hypothetical protein [Tanacetum cinerariifolium]
MAALVISISLDVSIESVESSFSRVIHIGSIFVEVPVAPEVGAAAVALPAGVLELDTHSSSEADLSKSSPPPVYVAPMVSHFLCSNNSESDTEIPEIHVSPTPHDAMITRICQREAILIRPDEDIPIGRLYRTHPGRPCRALTVRNLVGPLPSHRLALRYTSHYLDYFTSGSSVHSSLDHSSSRHSISGHSLPRHASPDTTVADSSTPPRFVHLPLARTLQSKPIFVRGLSHYLPLISSSYALRDLVPSRADLLPPRKRFRNSISPEDSVKEDIDTDVLEDIKADATAIEVAVDRDVEVRIDVEVGVDVVARIDIPDGMLMPDIVEHLEQRQLEVRSLIVGGERASLLDQNMTITRSGMTPEAIKELVNQRVEEADNGNGGNGNGGIENGGNGNDGDGNGNGENRNPSENNRDARTVVRECTYQDFMKCQPLNFKETEGVFRLTRWFEKMEIVFHINNCPEKYQVKELMKLMAKRFQKLTMMYTKMVFEEEDMVEKFIGGISGNTQGNLIPADATRLQDVVRIANNLMDQKLKGYAVKNIENKRRLEVNQRDNHGQ